MSPDLDELLILLGLVVVLVLCFLIKEEGDNER